MCPFKNSIQNEENKNALKTKPACGYFLVEAVSFFSPFFFLLGRHFVSGASWLCLLGRVFEGPQSSSGAGYQQPMHLGPWPSTTTQLLGSCSRPQRGTAGPVSLQGRGFPRPLQLSCQLSSPSGQHPVAPRGPCPLCVSWGCALVLPGTEPGLVILPGQLGSAAQAQSSTRPALGPSPHCPCPQALLSGSSPSAGDVRLAPCPLLCW